eukprot:102514_1
MANAVLMSMHSITNHSTNYTEWTRAGILNFDICAVFNDIELNGNDNCPLYQSFDSDRKSKYKAIATFGIITDQSLNKYKNYLMTTMMTDNFMNVFQSNMNNALNDEINLTQQRRRILLDKNDNFEVISIEIIDPLNVTKNTEYDDSQISKRENNYDETIILLIIIILSTLCLIVFVVIFVYYKKSKNKQMNLGKEGEIDQQIEMNQGEERQKQDIEGNANGMTGKHDADDLVVNAMIKQNDDDEIVAIVNRTKNHQDSDDDDLVEIINQTESGLIGNNEMEIKQMNQNWQQDQISI